MSLSRKLTNESSAVSSFYDEFPFPSDPPKDQPPLGFNWPWSVETVYSACTGASFTRKNSCRPIDILDAGCGTGVSTDYLFIMQNPDLLTIYCKYIMYNP